MSTIPPPDHDDFVQSRAVGLAATKAALAGRWKLIDYSPEAVRGRMLAHQKNRVRRFEDESEWPVEDGIYIGTPTFRYRVWRFLHRKGWI